MGTECFDTTGLKPCPFCGSMRLYKCTPMEGLPFVNCCDCWGEIRSSTLEKAIVAWNRRAGEKVSK